LSELGADTSASIHLEPNGLFPNHIPNPEDKKAMEATVKAVKESGADVGVCLDTDADRCDLVDETGKELNRNRLVALVSKLALESFQSEKDVVGKIGDNHVGVVVTDSSTSNGVTKFIEKCGGEQIRYRKGYRHVIQLGRKTPNCVAAVECSGHGGWRDNDWVDDGCYTALRALTALAQLKRGETNGINNEKVGLSSLVKDLSEPAESVEIRLPMIKGYVDMQETSKLVIEDLGNLASQTEGWVVEKVNHEGLRVTVGRQNDPNDGWVMMRASLHEPILSVQIESDTKKGTRDIAKALLAWEPFAQNVDVTPLKKFI
jgi:phosphomannomutase